MLIDNIYKNVDAYGNIVEAYVILYDMKGVKYRRNITNNREYNYYMEMLSRQNKRTEELKNLTPKSEYIARTYRYMLPEYNTKGVKIFKPLVAILTSLVIAGSAGAIANYEINKDNTNLTAVTRIPNDFGTKLSSLDKYVTRNEGKFTDAARSIFSGDYSDAPEFDGEFIKDYIESCYKANTDAVLSGDWNKPKYKFNFEQFMTATDIIAYHTKANSEGYKSFIKRMKTSTDPNSIEYYTSYDSHLEKYLEEPLSFILQHLDPKDDEFSKISPLARIVICEEVKSVLRLAREDYSFFNHAFPTRNQTRDELIEAINAKENAAIENLNMTIKNKKDSKVLKK